MPSERTFSAAITLSPDSRASTAAAYRPQRLKPSFASPKVVTQVAAGRPSWPLRIRNDSGLGNMPHLARKRDAQGLAEQVMRLFRDPKFNVRHRALSA